ncbi:MAG TPA: c-type cytochrome [candidate division Zixibacteria bacterium]|nr:c-type cytochrome [candidate division Zixibacteria bacterium]
MVIRRLMGEWSARLFLILLIAGLFAAILFGRRTAQAVEIHAVMPERGGWLPGNLTAEVNVPLNLRLISDDVLHGFAVGQQPWPAVDLVPGQMTELTLTFDEPGTYTYYCTRWCGLNHWRMRGTIEVKGEENAPSFTGPGSQPPFMTLGLDLDQPHEVEVDLDRPPSADLGEKLDFTIPTRFATREIYFEETPYQFWQDLREDPGTVSLSDIEIWDLVAFVWQSETTLESLEFGQRLYDQNCAACHGENGDGDGVMAMPETGDYEPEVFGESLMPPGDFTDSQKMLGASTALLQGKIMRGGMGTGMPYWGTIFTDEEIDALIDYIWSFQFPFSNGEL